MIRGKRKMITKEIQEALAETSILLDNVETEIVETIPISVREFIKTNASVTTFKYDVKVPLAEQKLMPETKGIIAFLYKEYICDENEKQQFMEQYIKFVRGKEQEKKAFDAEAIFGRELKEELVQKTDMQLSKQTWYEKIIRMLRKVFIRTKK